MEQFIKILIFAMYPIIAMLSILIIKKGKFNHDKMRVIFSFAIVGLYMLEIGLKLHISEIHSIADPFVKNALFLRNISPTIFSSFI
jgi:uncharacterized membrane protein